MAFWIKKPSDGESVTDESEKKSTSRPKAKEQKEDKKSAIKRIDNLRIPERLKINLKSFGSQTRYAFLTKDLSATGVFVLCQNFASYPFQPNSTLIEATVELLDPMTQQTQQLDFIARIARVVEAHGAGSASISGFGLRIIQMDFAQRQYLEAFIASHGKPDMASVFGSATIEHSADNEILTTTFGHEDGEMNSNDDEQIQDLSELSDDISNAV